MAERLQDGELFYIENCQWTFNDAPINLRRALRKAAKRLCLGLRAMTLLEAVEINQAGGLSLGP